MCIILKIKKKDDNLFLMSWKDIKEIHNSEMPVSFGSHTLNHPDLIRLSDEQIEKEMTLSKKEHKKKDETGVLHYLKEYKLIVFITIALVLALYIRLAATNLPLTDEIAR